MATKSWAWAQAAAVLAMVYAVLLAATAGLMAAAWAIRGWAGDTRFDTVMHVGFGFWLVVVEVGVLPALVLRALKARRLVSFLMCGALSALTAFYAVLFAAEFQFLWAFCCLDTPALPVLVKRIFADAPLLFGALSDVGGTIWLAVAAASGLFNGLMAWLALRSKAAKTG